MPSLVNYPVRRYSTHETQLQEYGGPAAAVLPVDVLPLPEELSFPSIFWSDPECQDFKARYVGARVLLIMKSRNNLFPEDGCNDTAES